MGIARKILENTFVQFGGKIITAVLSVFVLKMISGYLGTSGYGDYTTVYQYLAFFGIAADFGIFTITVKEMSKDEKNIPRILGNVLGLRTALAILTMGLAAIVVFLIPSYSDTVIPMGVLIATFATIFTLLNGTVSSVLQVHLKMQYTTVGLIAGKIASVAYIAAVVYYLFVADISVGFEHLIWAGVLGNFVMLAITTYYAKRYTKITYCFDFAYWKKIFFTSLPYGVALVLNNIYFRLDVILLTMILPHTRTLADGTTSCSSSICGDTEAGLYGVGMRFLEMMIIIPVYYMNSVLPVMTRFLEEEREKVKQIIQYSFDFLVATAMPIMVGGFILAIPIIRLISDEDFVSGVVHAYGADIAVQFLMFAMFFSFINALFGFTLVVLNRQAQLMYINAACVLFNLVSNLAVIPYWGFRGAAATSILCELFILVLTGLAVKRAFHLKLEFTTAWKITLSSVVMGLFVASGFYWLNGLWYIYQLALLVPLGGLAYIIMMMLTKAITPEMWQLLKKR
ncbi:flippase [Patescibacteria group bacterium]|nr:flippase [Patescibacteria group bacterium]MBU1015608.1 flippase [Patescibacteria group bacterium]MBU1685015.1 flippase [Patescibacteria group bacterium]MBU1938121.1 flippase [Patescibacteria group bacterium]